MPYTSQPHERPSLSALLSVALAVGCAGPNALKPCGADDQCSLDEGNYYAWPPSDWDGVTPLPVVVIFHGHGGSPTGASIRPMQAAADQAGALMVAPEGDANTWNVTNVDGFSATDRDEMDFMDALFVDLSERLPLHETHRLATGFSQGASMAALLGCKRGDVWPAALTMSGTFWDPHPRQCAQDAATVRHVHGDSDTTWPRAGRALGRARQGNADDSIELWTTSHGCRLTETFEDGPLSCQRWSECDSGATVEDCRHAEGHTRLDGWEDRTIGWWQSVRDWRRPE